MEIVLIKDATISGRKYKRADRLIVTNQLAVQLIEKGDARHYPNIIEKIENGLGRIIKTKKK